MADINVKNQSSSQGSSQTSGSSQGSSAGGGQSSSGQATGLQREHRESGLSRSRGSDPFGFFISPAEFFSSNPFTLMRRMSEEMDRMFGQSLQQSGSSSGTSGGFGWSPALEVREHEGQLQIHADLPGIKPEDVKVEVTEDALVIRGERKSEHEHHVGKAYRSERRYGSFYREIPLPEGVNTEQAKAQFRNGVLEITIPVPEQVSRRREIPINTSESTGTGSTVSAGHGGSVSSGAAGAGAGGGTGTAAQSATAGSSSSGTSTQNR